VLSTIYGSFAMIQCCCQCNEPEAESINFEESTNFEDGPSVQLMDQTATEAINECESTIATPADIQTLPLCPSAADSQPENLRLFGKELPTAQEPPLQESVEFPVSVVVAQGQSLGLSVDSSDEKTFLIRIVRQGGAAEAWNIENPEFKLGQGMRIVEVNGMRDNMDKMIPEFQKPGRKNMLVRRAERLSYPQVWWVRA